MERVDRECELLLRLGRAPAWAELKLVAGLGGASASTHASAASSPAAADAAELLLGRRTAGRKRRGE